MRIKRRRRGFTLIELLVVIVILGILMAVAVPTYLRQQAKAQDSRTQQYLTTAFKAIRAGLPDTNNQYPSSTSMVSWIQQSEPELTAERGDCLTGVTSTPVDAVLVDLGSTASSLQLCARSQSGNVWKLTASATGGQQLLDGTLVPLTMSGNEITDATRAADIEGDGLSNDSSTGIWEGTTNLIYNGGAESGTSYIGNNGGAISSDGTYAKFGSKSLKITYTTASSDGYTDWTDSTVLLAEGVNAIPVTGGQPYTLSMWLKLPVALVGTGDVHLRMIEFDSSGAFVADTSSGVNILQSVGTTFNWTRVTFTLTLHANTAYVAPRLNINNLTGSLWADGVQFEPGAVATPYVETNDASASRGAARVQVSASLLNATQGWVALRLRMGWSATGPFPSSGLNPVFFNWGDDNNDRITLAYNINSGVQQFQVNRVAGGAGVGSPLGPTQSFASGNLITVIFAWTASAVELSAEGSAFASIADATSPNLTATSFDIGSGGTVKPNQWCDSSVLWFATGTGTLADSDASTINSWGNADPLVSRRDAGVPCFRLTT